ncbi:MarR family transcriptional regulator [Microbacterium sp. ARD31]|uniref:MarR family winged helix-turn-helix transcriptional regulator n=1 Tax=Microbacterium sp. ARD31 TaxID=2962576 RepID=UPI002882354A|nr:MarR family transcriptional regulator [Microbacterium sp. ARD31]MDT0183985.1 MarR family transcriptional regulator [Microbacterium sp. ARD31]
MDTEQAEPMRFTGFLLRRAQQVHVALWTREVSAEISSVQYGVLAVLERHPGASQRELGDELDLDRSTIADLAARLDRRGLIDRRPHAGDRRRNTLWLTEAGEEELTRLRRGAQRVESLLTDHLERRDRAELRVLLRSLLGDTAKDVGR